jgi:hypothetical protein
MHPHIAMDLLRISYFDRIDPILIQNVKSSIGCP